MKTALVCGAGGFIGGHLVKRLKKEGYWVRGVDIKTHEYVESQANDFVKGDLRDPRLVENVINKPFDEVYQLAANMGGMGFISYNDGVIMHDSVLINVNVLEASRLSGVKKIFFSSSFKSDKSTLSLV